jgi:hypothetical protein
MDQISPFISLHSVIKKNLKRYSRAIAIQLLLIGLCLESVRYFTRYVSISFNSPFLDFLSRAPIGLGVFLLAATLILFFYLQGDTSRPSRSPDYPFLEFRYSLDKLTASMPGRADYDRLSTELKELKSYFTQQQIGLGIDDKTREDILQALKKELAAATGNQLLVAIEEKYAPAVIRQTEYNRLLGDFDALKERLNIEVQSLNRRANSNLAFGSVLTFVAMAGLTYVVLKAEVNYQDVTSVLHYYIPRLSFVIFIEVFAYFFLKLYKSNLSDTKYYQNELTNIESKIISLKSALLNQDKSAAKAIIIELSKTERNFVLKKGESTVDLEKAKLDVKQIKEILDLGTSLIGSKKAR